MGNRAVIVLEKSITQNTPGIYLHWNGGPESVLAFMDAANKLGVREGDKSYEFARIVQIIGNYFGGTLSLGVGVIATLDDDNGDNGLFQVIRENGSVSIIQYPEGLKDRSKKILVDCEEIRSKHPYWTNPDNNPDGNILDQVLKKNPQFVGKTES